MWIRTLKGGLINTDQVIMIEINGSTVLFMASADFPRVIGEYSNYENAKKVVDKIMYAIKQDKKVFAVPAEDELLKDENKAETESKAVKSKSKGNTSRVIELWNDLENKGLKPVTRISPSSDRYKLLTARIREFGMENVEKAIENIRLSDYLCKQKWFNFDWFIRPNNFPKVLDGNYNDDKTEELDSFWND